MKALNCQSFVARMILFVVFFTLIIFSFGWIITGKFWLPDLLEDFVYVSLCTCLCSALLNTLYHHIIKLPKLIFFIVFMVLASLGVGLGIIIGALIVEGRFVANTIFFLAILIGIIASAGVTFYETQKTELQEKITQLKAAELENEQLKRLESESRLNSLQAKLNPHFLFNTLNSTAALIYDDPHKAEESIVMLSDLYRKILSTSDKTFIPLSEELELIEDYLKLEKLRFNENLSYTITCPDELRSHKIPCLLIEPLVENSIKHTRKTSDKNIEIDVSISREGNNMLISVSDNGPGFVVEEVNYGFGFSSIQERLRLLFANKYSFEIHSQKGKGTEITIRIPV